MIAFGSYAGKLEAITQYAFVASNTLLQYNFTVPFLPRVPASIVIATLMEEGHSECYPELSLAPPRSIREQLYSAYHQLDARGSEDSGIGF